VTAYEGLRREALQPDGRGEYLRGRGVLMHHGLATWAQIMAASVSEVPALDSVGVELVRLIAGLILSSQQEGVPRG
jgi:hypothetical protein